VSQIKNHQEYIKAVNDIPAIKNILEVICQSTKMGFAAVARVTTDQWIACAVNDKINFGLTPGGELKIETTICNSIRQTKLPVIINEVDNDSAYKDHPVPAMYGFQSYISIPIFLKNGDFFGTLCAIDPKPAVIDTFEIKNMFQLFAELIAFHLDALDKIHLTETKLAEEKENAALREKFIAILGHDLRNPIGASLNASQLLTRMPLEDKAKRLAKIVQSSSIRIIGLIDNLLDFARGRLGNGIILENLKEEPLETTLVQVIEELKLLFPSASIATNFELEESVFCDSRRIAQLFSNLLANALSHGNMNDLVKVSATSKDGEFNLQVTNNGQPIAQEIITKLFQPFSKGENSTQKGLGLGLYISSEIAKAHRGKLTVTSTHEETCFALNFPGRP
jgi:signal transduction histidine kinase